MTIYRWFSHQRLEIRGMFATQLAATSRVKFCQVTRLRRECPHETCGCPGVISTGAGKQQVAEVFSRQSWKFGEVLQLCDFCARIFLALQGSMYQCCCKSPASQFGLEWGSVEGHNVVNWWLWRFCLKAGTISRALCTDLSLVCRHLHISQVKDSLAHIHTMSTHYWIIFKICDYSLYARAYVSIFEGLCFIACGLTWNTSFDVIHHRGFYNIV